MISLSLAFLDLDAGSAIVMRDDRADGQVCEVTNMFDICGDEILDPDEATACVVMVESDCWLTIDIQAFDAQTVH